MDDTDNRVDNIADFDAGDVADIAELDQIEDNILEFMETKKTNSAPNEKKQDSTTQKTQTAQPTTSKNIPDPTPSNSNTTQKHGPVAKKDVRKVQEEPQPVNASRPLRKDALISNILKLQEHVPGYEKRSKTYYSRKKVAELQNILGDLTQRGANALQGVQNDEDEDVIPVENLERGESKANISAGSALFHFNLIVAQFCEAVSINYEDKIGTSLKGFTQDIVDNREALEECLAEVYAENQEMLDPYISGQNKYFLLMATLGGQRLFLNKKKSSHGVRHGEEEVV